MSGDYTRMRYSPRSGYIGVLEQQGRVRLDADGNELVEAIDRRRRAETIDTIGFAVFPTDPVNGVTTTNAFLIADTGGVFTIGQGRGYVDGIQVDCWGEDPQQFQPNLGELVGENPLPYISQPFFYKPGFPVPAAAGNSIVYLDVWEREVTALEDPGLMDPALEGIDTTTRIQAAWQVKSIATTASACSDLPPEWTSLIASSTGVLSTATVPATSGNSPCIIDPVGGYTGLENRLFRVQIYKSGSVGGGGSPAATFVWSEDNASLGATIGGVTQLTAASSQISVSTVGRDKTFRFQVGDTLEVLDDFVEWSIRETNSGGQLVTVLDVDPEQLTLTVDQDLSGWFSGLPAGINPRLRKWDAASQPTNNGTAILLTDGVTVTFGADAAATLKAGDYWLFYARTATGKIEILNDAPPRGLHHYAKLAVVNPAAIPPVQDCRVLWPPSFGSEGCCTFVVNVGDDIQSVVDKVPITGGCICLKAGQHVLPKTLVFQQKQKLMFHGESIGAVVQGPPEGQILRIQGGREITVQSISFQAITASSQAVLIELDEVKQCAFRDCVVSAQPSESGAQTIASVGFRMLKECTQVEISDCQISGTLGGIFATPTSDCAFLRNQIAGPNLDGVSGGMIGIEIFDASGSVRIVDNLLSDFAWPIFFETFQSQPVNSTISGNTIQRNSLSPNLPQLLNFPGALGSIISTKTYAITSFAAGCEIADNLIQSTDPGHGGILVCSANNAVERNRIFSSVTPGDNEWNSLPVGLVIYQPEQSSAGHARAIGNHLQGAQNGIVALAEEFDFVEFPEIADNLIDPTVSLTTAIPMDNPASAITSIENALLQLNNNAKLPAPFGILLINFDGASVIRNIVSQFGVGIAAMGPLRQLEDPIFEANFSDVSLEGNHVDLCSVGVLMTAVEHASLRNGVFQNNSYSIALDTNTNLTVEGNNCTGRETLVHCFETSGFAVQLRKNTIVSGATGILSYESDTITIAENEIESTDATGILVDSCWNEANVIRNRVSGCGLDASSAAEASLVGTAGPVGASSQWNFGTAVSVAIALVECTGTQSVEGCHMLNTAQVAQGNCADVLILNGAHAKVRDCQIDRQNDRGVAVVDSGIFVYPTLDSLDSNFTGADISGNHLNMAWPTGSDGTRLLPIDVEDVQTAAQSDILFNGNMVLQRNGGPVAVKLAADALAVTGNRIRSKREERFSLEIRYASALSYVGNVVSFGQRINGVITQSKGPELPIPPEKFNVNK